MNYMVTGPLRLREAKLAAYGFLLENGRVVLKAFPLDLSTTCELMAFYKRVRGRGEKPVKLLDEFVVH